MYYNMSPVIVDLFLYIECGNGVAAARSPVLRAAVRLNSTRYRGLVRLPPFLSPARPARRRASASAPPDAGSFALGGGVRGRSFWRAAVGPTPVALRLVPAPGPP